jgi:DNA-binding transcriptional LysR family regulator
MRLDLRQLRHVLALDRHRNFARAAEDVGLTQPALSRSLQALEEELGAKLFDRDRSRVQPTALGKRLVELSRPLLNQAKLVERDLRLIIGLGGGMLRVGAAPYAADVSVGRSVGRLLRAHPDIRMDLSVGDWPELQQKVLTDELDIVVAECSHALEDERLTVESLPRHQGVFYCRAGHPLARRDNLSLDDLSRFPFAFTTVPKRLKHLLAARGEPRGELPDGTTVTDIRVGAPCLAKRIVLDSDAISAAIPLQIREELVAGQLVALPLDAPTLRTDYGIIRLTRRTLSPAAVAFVAVLREVEAEIAAGTL